MRQYERMAGQYKTIWKNKIQDIKKGALTFTPFFTSTVLMPSSYTWNACLYVCVTATRLD